MQHHVMGEKCGAHCVLATCGWFPCTSFYGMHAHRFSVQQDSCYRNHIAHTVACCLRQARRHSGNTVLLILLIHLMSRGPLCPCHGL